MTSLSTPSPELLEALRSVPGVADLGAPDENGTLIVDLSAGADEATVGAALAALLWEQASVETVGTALVEEVGPIGSGGRLGVEDLRLQSSATGVQVSLVLALDEATAPGSASASGPVAEVTPGAVATAVLLALEDLTEDAVIGTVELARVDGVAEVRLRLDIDGTEVLGTGDAAVVGHAPQAVVRAVLAALEPHLPG